MCVPQEVGLSLDSELLRPVELLTCTLSDRKYVKIKAHRSPAPQQSELFTAD